MNESSIAAVFRALNDAGARYLVAGGLAVVAHGYVRLTLDVDLVMDLSPGNLTRAFEALERLGYRPKVPVRMADFASPTLRESWIRDKGMVVFQLVSETHRTVPLDIFAAMPFDFAAVHGRAPRFEVADGVEIPVVPLTELLAMKERANRPKDQIDLLYLRKLATDAGYS